MDKGEGEDRTINRHISGEQPSQPNVKKPSDQQPVSRDLPIAGRPARFFAWLGNHFFAVTLLLTATLLIWAIGFASR